MNSTRVKNKAKQIYSMRHLYRMDGVILSLAPNDPKLRQALEREIQVIHDASVRRLSRQTKKKTPPPKVRNTKSSLLRRGGGVPSKPSRPHWRP